MSKLRINCEYSRKDLWKIFRPGEGEMPRGGNWGIKTYIRHRQGNNAIICLNIGVKNGSGVVFNNMYDEEKKEVTWVGNSGSRSKQPRFKWLINEELTPYLFARWDNEPIYTFLGVGKFIRHENGARLSKDLSATGIKMVHSVKDSPQSICPKV